MKPVIIIAVAVVCSVVAVLGVLIGLQQISDYEAQIIYDYEKTRLEIEYAENKAICDLLSFPYDYLLDENYLYDYCLNTDYLLATDAVIDLCIFEYGEGENVRKACNKEYLKLLADAVLEVRG